MTILQEGGSNEMARPRFHHEVRDFKDRELPGKWTGCRVLLLGRLVLTAQLPQIFLLGCRKDAVYLPPLGLQLCRHLPNG
jgi:hypothetical protein